jgi:hypothetical protein
LSRAASICSHRIGPRIWWHSAHVGGASTATRLRSWRFAILIPCEIEGEGWQICWAMPAQGGSADRCEGRGEHGISERLRQTGDASSPGRREPRHSGDQPWQRAVAGGLAICQASSIRPAHPGSLSLAAARRSGTRTTASDRPAARANEAPRPLHSRRRLPGSQSAPAKLERFAFERARRRAPSTSWMQMFSSVETLEWPSWPCAIGARSIVTPDCPRGWRPGIPDALRQLGGAARAALDWPLGGAAKHAVNPAFLIASAPGTRSAAERECHARANVLVKAGEENV